MTENERADERFGEEGVSIVTINFPRNIRFLEQLLLSIRNNTSGVPFEVILVINRIGNHLSRYEAIKKEFSFVRKIIGIEEVFSFSENCNLGAEHVKGRYLLFLNDDVQVREGWLRALVAGFKVPKVGIVGSKAVYPQGRVQHCGIVFISDSGKQFTRHCMRNYKGNHWLVNIPRFHQAVTGACLLIERERWIALKGFDPAYRMGFEDIDLAFRMRGVSPDLQVLYTPFSEIIHYEGASRGRIDKGLDANEKTFLSRFQDKITVDADEYLRPDHNRVSEEWDEVLRCERQG